MDIIVAACVSQFHDSDDEFELLLAYNDGREIGHTMTRAAAKQMASECADAIGDGSPDRRTMTKKIDDGGLPEELIDAAAAICRGLGIASTPTNCLPIIDGLKAYCQRDQWQPIETAPKGANGMAWMLLAYGPADDQSVGVGMRFHDQFFAASTFYKGGPAGERQYIFREHEVHPTHWVPLPSPPRALDQKGSSNG